MHSAVRYPGLIEPEQLATELDRMPGRVIVDLRKAEHYLAGHIPGAIHLDYQHLVRSSPPTGGLLPEPEAFNRVVQYLGLQPDSEVLVYDGEGGAAASRLVWNLACYGFTKCRLISGGSIAWSLADLPSETRIIQPAGSSLTLSRTGDALIDTDTLLTRLDHDDLALMDTRTREEYTGEKIRANHGGRIPGAIRLEWTDLLDRNAGYRVLPEDRLHEMLHSLGFADRQHVVVYCQTHHRSALNYLVLKALGYPRVSALDGAWSSWGNRHDTPKQVGTETR